MMPSSSQGSSSPQNTEDVAGPRDVSHDLDASQKLMFDSPGSQQRSALVAQLRGRRNLLRCRAKLLLEQVPAIAPEDAPPPPSSTLPPPRPNLHLHNEDISVLSLELQRAAWNPTLELAHLVFNVCSHVWEGEHQRRSAGILAFHASRGDRVKSDLAWDALLKGTDEISMERTPQPLSIIQSAGMPSPMSHATLRWEAQLAYAQRKMALLHSHEHPTTLSSLWIDSAPERVVVEDAVGSTDGSDDDLETLVALKHAEFCEGRRAVVHKHPTPLSQLLLRGHHL